MPYPMRDQAEDIVLCRGTDAENEYWYIGFAAGHHSNPVVLYIYLIPTDLATKSAICRVSTIRMSVSSPTWDDIIMTKQVELPFSGVQLAADLNQQFNLVERHDYNSYDDRIP